tara:strand:- start:72 stop:752 length:681 start_codon:yes stop_codon:yes gene_type:complete
MGRARQIAGRGNNDSLVLDSSAADTDVGELLLLDGTDASSSNAGFSTLQEDATDNAFDGGPFILSEAPISVANPAFRVGLSASQNLSHSTYTKLNYTFVQYDVGGYYDNTTNYRYQPLIAGYYQFNAAQLENSNLDVYDFILAFYKNGVSVLQSRIRLSVPGVSNEDLYASVINLNDVIHMNGTTDYLEVYMRSTSEDGSGTMVAYGNQETVNNTSFSGSLISRTS